MLKSTSPNSKPYIYNYHHKIIELPNWKGISNHVNYIHHHGEGIEKIKRPTQ